MTFTDLFPTRTPLDVLPPTTSQEAATMPVLSSVTLTASYRPPTIDGWPPVPIGGRPTDVDLVTVTATAYADGSTAVASFVSLRAADSTVTWAGSPDGMPAFISSLIDDAKKSAVSLVGGAR